MRPWRTSKTVTLRSAAPHSSISVSVDIDLDKITPEDKKFVGAVLAIVAAYEPGPEDADLFEGEIANLRKQAAT